MSPSMDMLKRIELESRGKKPEQVIDLNLDNCRSSGEPEGLSSEYTALEKLSMINVGFTSLKGFPTLPNILKLELSDNRISGTLGCLKGCTTLTHLNLSGNKIKTFDALQPLGVLTKLRSLDLFNNDVTKEDSYREKVFKLLPSLLYLDGFDSNDVEAVDSEDEEVSGDEENGQNGHHNEEEGSDDEDDEDFDEESDEDENGDVDDEEEKLLEEVGNGAGASSNGVEEEDDSESEEEIGLDYLQKTIDEDESDDEDYLDGDGGEEDEDIDEDSDVEGSGEPPRKVRKQEEEEA